MTDKYLSLVNTGFTKKIATALGLPRPAMLRRQGFSDVRIPLSGTTVVLGEGADADAIAHLLLEWDLDVRRSAPSSGKIAAIVPVFTALSHPDQMGTIAVATGTMLRNLTPGGRVVTISRTPADPAGVIAADNRAAFIADTATQAGISGFMRSLAKEMRAGATTNGILLDEVGVHAPSVAGALRFLLSANSAFVDGQFLTVSSEAGTAPADPAHPLSGQVAVVTGAARGIGEAIAKVLARDGAHVIGVDVPAAGESLAAVMNAIRGTAVQADITLDGAADKLADVAKSRFGRLDIVVHNAGVTRDKLLANMTSDQWDLVVAVNLAAQLRMNETFAARTDLTPDGLDVVSLASTSGIAGNRGQTNYGYTKAGVIGLTAALAPVLAKNGGTANAVAPGFIETDMTANIPMVTRQVARRLNSLQQGGQPIDVAEAISFLASPAAGGINGTTLRVCGQNLLGQ